MNINILNIIKDGIKNNYKAINTVCIIDNESDFITEIYNSDVINSKLINTLLENIKENSSVKLDYEKNLITINYDFEKSQFWQGYNKTIIFISKENYKFCGSVQRYINKNLEV